MRILRYTLFAFALFKLASAAADEPRVLRGKHHELTILRMGWVPKETPPPAEPLVLARAWVYTGPPMSIAPEQQKCWVR